MGSERRSNRRAIPARPPSPGALKQRRPATRLKRRSQNNHRQKILAERIVEYEKKVAAAKRVEQMKTYKNAVHPSSPNNSRPSSPNKEAVGQPVQENNSAEDEEARERRQRREWQQEQIAQNRLERPRSPTPSRFYNDSPEESDNVGGRTITTQLLQLQIDGVKRDDYLKEENQKQKLFLGAHENVKVHKYYVGKGLSKGTKCPPSESLYAKKIIGSVAANAASLQSFQATKIKGMNKWNVMKESPTDVQQKNTVQQLVETEAGKIVAMVNVPVVSETESISSRPSSPRKGDPENLRVSGNKVGPASTFKQVESFHFDPRVVEKPKSPRTKLVESERKRRRRPKSAAPSRRRVQTSSKATKRPKSAGRSGEARPNSAGQTRMSSRLQKKHREMIFQKKVDKHMYSPRYRHVVYTVPISQAQTKHAFGRIAKLAAQIEPGKPEQFHSGNLRVSKNGDLYQVDGPDRDITVNGKVLVPRTNTPPRRIRNPHAAARPEEPRTSRCPTHMQFRAPPRKPVKLLIEKQSVRGKSVSQKYFENHLYQQARSDFSKRGTLLKSKKGPRPKSASSVRSKQKLQKSRDWDIVNYGRLKPEDSLRLRNQAFEEYKATYNDSLVPMMSPTVTFEPVKKSSS